MLGYNSIGKANSDYILQGAHHYFNETELKIKQLVKILILYSYNLKTGDIYMKIGKLDFKDFAAKKPIGFSPSGKFITAGEVLSEPSLQLGSLLTLTKNQQVELTTERYNLEPDFKLGIIGVGLLTKKEIIDHVKRQDSFGKTVVEAEMGYCSELMANINIKPLVLPVSPIKPIPIVPDWKPIKKCMLLKMKTRALFCENTTDGVTSPFASYRLSHVHPVFASRGFTVIALTGTNDVRNNFIVEAKNGLTVYISGIGHGSYSLYTGNNGNHILEVGYYDPAEVSGKAIHFLSCQTAGQLGPNTITKGAKSYLGYTENFHLVWDNAATPVNEFLCFAEADSTFDIAMANGSTAQQAYNATIANFNFQLTKPGIPGSAAGTWLKYDRDHCKLLGDGSTVILPYRYVKICFPLLNLEKENALVAAGELADE